MHACDAAVEPWWPAAGSWDHFDDLVVMVDGGHFPTSAGEYQQRIGVEGEIGGHCSQRPTAGEQPVLLGGGECCVKAVMVHRALAERPEEQGAVGGLGEDFSGTEISEQ